MKNCASFLFFFMICAMIMRVNSWQTSNILENFLIISGHSDLREYSLTISSINSTEHIIIFGGYSLSTENGSKILNNNLYTINFETKETKIWSESDGTKPSARFGSCGLYMREKFYIYGGYTEGDFINNELWEYNFLTQQWTKKKEQLWMKQCHMAIVTNTYQNDTIGIFGVENETLTFSAQQFSVLTEEMQIIEIVDTNALTISNTLWDGEVYESALRIKKTGDKVSSNTSPNQKFYSPILNLCLIPSSWGISIVTDKGVHVMYKTSGVYQYFLMFDFNLGHNQNITCGAIGNWTMVAVSQQIDEQENFEIVLEYYYRPTRDEADITSKRQNLNVQWLPSFKYFNAFMTNGSVFVINENLQVYKLDEQCDSSITSSDSVMACNFGMITCKDNFAGPNCSYAQCPGSMRLTNGDGFAVIEIVCSGNGKCTENGCVCEGNWGGEKCDIYQRSACHGVLDQNFLAANCECSESNKGGNDCSVTFCYNDCSGKGTCSQDTGECTCDTDYTGPDCSILKINFDLI